MSEARNLQTVDFDARARQVLSQEPLLSAKDVEVTFSLRGNKLVAIRRASLDLYEGETLAIVGESGSGKSVFTKCFVGMLDKNGSTTTIYSTDKDVNQTLRGVGFDQVFNLVEDKSNLDKIFGEIEADKFEKKDKTIMMLSAHRCLMNINEKNQQTFKDVVSLMEQSLKSKL